jgi:hypothetical protein
MKNKQNLLTGALLITVFAMSIYISNVKGFVRGVDVTFDAMDLEKDSKKEEDEA